MPTCPNGHQSGSDDWCEVCGHRMAGVPPLPPPPPPGAGYGYPAPGSPPPGPGGRSGVPDPNAELCPQCRTPREGAAPFCEECRWNFLTNTATSYTPAAPRPSAGAPSGPPGPGGSGIPGVPGVPGGQSPYGPPGGHGGQNPAPRYPQPGPGQQGGPGAGGPGHDPFEYQSSRPSQMNRPAEPIPPGPGAQPYGGPQGFGGDPSRQAAPPVSGGHGAPQQAYTQQPSPPPFTQGGPQHGGPQHGGPQHGGPQHGGPAFGSGDDDWVIPPPSSGSPGGQGGPGQGGDYGYPQPGATQAPPGPGYQQQPQPQQQQQQQSLSWSATIAPDREYFMAMMQRSGPEAAGLNLPAYSPELQRPLLGNQITIGRRRHSTGESPDIDLSVPPEDPGVSHQHAVLVQQPDSTWAVVDQNSTNGTTVNGGEEPIQPFVPVPLQDGDRVHVGAWTTITIRRG
ncbi:FHA domain-containing protein [Streptomyces sp. NPDC005281]|uniref:FHA domain-containing protein n=1 Tax=Streptomyces sp. NPDC005281 TaxID=3155712 RepID=UPI0033B73E68